jgi:hypothetical protein
MRERFLIRGVAAAGETIDEASLTQREAFDRARELYREFGADLEIEIYLNDSARGSAFFNKSRMRKWYREGMPEVRGC